MDCLVRALVIGVSIFIFTIFGFGKASPQFVDKSKPAFFLEYRSNFGKKNFEIFIQPIISSLNFVREKNKKNGETVFVAQYRVLLEFFKGGQKKFERTFDDKIAVKSFDDTRRNAYLTRGTFFSIPEGEYDIIVSVIDFDKPHAVAKDTLKHVPVRVLKYGITDPLFVLFISDSSGIHPNWNMLVNSQNLNPAYQQGFLCNIRVPERSLARLTYGLYNRLDSLVFGNEKLLGVLDNKLNWKILVRFPVPVVHVPVPVSGGGYVLRITLKTENFLYETKKVIQFSPMWSNTKSWLEPFFWFFDNKRFLSDRISEDNKKELKKIRDSLKKERKKLEKSKKASEEEIRKIREKEFKFFMRFWQVEAEEHGGKSFKEEFLKRIAYINKNLEFKSDFRDTPNWKTDMGIMYAWLGPPAESDSWFRNNFEIKQWIYYGSDGRDVLVLRFYRRITMREFIFYYTSDNRYRP